MAFLSKENKESPAFTVVAAAVLCLACSVVVAGAYVSLKDMQDRNAELKLKRNVLEAAGLYDKADPEKALSADEIEAAFKDVKVVAVNLDDGTLNNTIDVATYSAEAAAKEADSRSVIGGSQPLAGFTYREDVALAYLVTSGSSFEKVVLPVYGKGLWSTLKGFIALDKDLRTVSGLTFYSHGETPGLGGEVDNPKWKSQWKGEVAIGDDGKPQMDVVKGGASPDDKSAVDGLSGATITSAGVENLVNYWLGDDGFGPFLARLSEGDVDLSAAPAKSAEMSEDSAETSSPDESQVEAVSVESAAEANDSDEPSESNAEEADK